MMKNITIKNKLRLPLFLIIALFLISSGINIKYAWLQNDLTQQLSSANQASVNLNDAYRDLYQASYAVSGMTIADSRQEFEVHKFEYDDNAFRAAPRLQSAAAIAEFMPTNFMNDVDTMVQSTNQWLSNYEMIKQSDEDNWADAFYENRLEAFRLFSIARDDLNVVGDAIELKISQLEMEITDARLFGERALEFSIALIVVLTLVILMLYNKTVIQPISALKEALQNIASGDGDLSQRLVSNSNDELGDISVAFNTFVHTIQNTVAKVTETSQSIHDELHELKKITAQISTSTSIQQADSQAVAAAVAEMQHASHSVCENANITASSAHQANDQVEATSHTIKNTINEITNLVSDVETAGDVINQLNNDVDKISSVLEVIRGIAEQTNLLALNAAIEAARAGEQGRGFAVVADEVRSLASRTQESTGEIHSMIERLQNGAKQAVDVMEQSIASSNHTISSAAQANDSLSSIETAIQDMSDKTDIIANAATEQSTVSNEITQNVQAIADASNAIVQVVSQAADRFQQMETQSLSLNKLVRQFKI
ncbi:methyl-accepting chemotaxis protein (plasmid) [Vibrio rotiferianus]|uniref:Methyl-accepting chemotaxis protein n=1 Tax=Vibrio rotiferianus TaxID=190895 RepID=A0A510IFZ4_9VIBR|nr:methyl-accepting chemotaxis protein [Vibrio rotiferianus]BBL92381.1 methyl-accepting chemotaxis protein [Vibrio rotiferianus]